MVTGDLHMLFIATNCEREWVFPPAHSCWHYAQPTFQIPEVHEGTTTSFIESEQRRYCSMAE
jgi:hypothetical protein